MKNSIKELQFLALVKHYGMSGFERNFRFCRENIKDKIEEVGVRKAIASEGFNDYQIDFAWPSIKIGVEVQGGIFMKRGAHTGSKAIIRDIHKQQCAFLCGWRIIPVEMASADSIGNIDMVLTEVKRILNN